MCTESLVSKNCLPLVSICLCIVVSLSILFFNWSQVLKIDSHIQYEQSEFSK